jgi:serine/threonine-protein kinase
MPERPRDEAALDPQADTRDHVPLDADATAERPTPSSPAVPAAAKKPAAPQKTSVLGDFRLVAKLGEGAMGAVYRARQVSTPRDAAVKVLSKTLLERPDFVQRFLREARLMARLDHVNVLRCYAAGQSHGYHYLAMEYAGGGSVGSWLARLGRFELPDAACVITAAARGLGYAHERNLVHRDVKPDNLLFSSKGVVKVADLGLARSADDGGDLTRTGTGIGTPLYASPEQARDAKHADARSDLYALGCVLYHLIAGKPPFEAKSLVELITAKERGTVAPLRRHRPGLPERVDRIVSRLLARLPEERHQSCAELLDDLAKLGPAPEVPSFFRKKEAGPEAG